MKPDSTPEEDAAGEAVAPLRRIIVRSLFDPVSGTRPGRWAALDEDGAVLLKNTASPLLSGARVLLKRDVSSETLVTMRHEGSETDAFKPVLLGQVARLTVSERADRPVRFETWKPLHAERRVTLKANKASLDASGSEQPCAFPAASCSGRDRQTPQLAGPASSERRDPQA